RSIAHQHRGGGLVAGRLDAQNDVAHLCFGAAFRFAESGTPWRATPGVVSTVRCAAAPDVAAPVKRAMTFTLSRVRLARRWGPPASSPEPRPGGNTKPGARRG